MVFMDPRDARLYQAWVADINQMELSGSDANLNVIVQIGFNAGHTYRYYVTLDQKKTEIRSPCATAPNGETVNPGDPDALHDFITWGKTNFPADHYAIVLAGHGQGWQGTMLFDNLDHLTLAELSSGLGALGAKFDVVLFYSCLMGQIEVGHQLEGRATMMVASEEVTLTVFPWQGFITKLKNNTGWNAGQFADTAAQDFAARLRLRPTATPLSSMPRIRIIRIWASLSASAPALGSQPAGRWRLARRPASTMEPAPARRAENARHVGMTTAPGRR